MEIEKALLMGEEKSFESQTESDKTELSDLKDRLAQIDESNRRWRALSLERIAEMKTKLTSSEKELQRLEKLHEEFCGSTDEETVLLERLKFQHELVEGDRKVLQHYKLLCSTKRVYVFSHDIKMQIILRINK